MTPAWQTVITAIDFEGTGRVLQWPDEPWQVGLVSLHDGNVAIDTAYERLLRIGDRPFNRYAPGRHAEYRQAMLSAPTLQQLWPELGRRLERSTLAAHNAPTERRYLSNAFPLHPPGIPLDTLKLARRIYPGLMSYSLDDLLKRLHLDARVNSLLPGRSPHDALYDALGSAVLLEHFFTLPGWREASMDMLIKAQNAK